jgi:SAM-dependent methyltransferase
MYRPLVNALPRYPIPRWPFPKPEPGLQLSLDIGCGWGRWMVAAAWAGYVPVGLDIQTSRLAAARRVLKQHGLRGYVVAADLRSLPFPQDLFQCVFSYSVLQHANREKCSDCVGDIRRVLRPGGSCCLEFPVSHGLTNWRYRLRPRPVEDPESWDVRYYSRKQLGQLFEGLFQSVTIETDCFFGTGVRGEDIDILPWKYKPVAIASECLKAAARVVPFARALVQWFSDSVFVRGWKPPGAVLPARTTPPQSPFGQDHNLWILPWLVCPVTQQPLEFDAESQTLLSRAAGLRFPIEGEIPILIEEHAETL